MTPSKHIWQPLRLDRSITGFYMPFQSKPEFATLIGVIIERWSMMEAELAHSMTHLIDGNGPAAHAIIFSINSTRNRISMVRAVAREVMPDGPEKVGLMHLLDKISNLGIERNSFVHGEFYEGAHKDALDLIVRRPDSSEPVKMLRVSVATLERHISNVEDRYVQLSAVNEEQTTLYRSRHLGRRWRQASR